MAVTLTEQNFQNEVLKTSLPVLIDFWAPWCSPCLVLTPVIDEVAKEYADRCRVCKVNVNETPAIAAKFGIMSIPTLIIFKDGKVVDKSVGFITKDQIVSKIQQAAAS